MRKISPFFQLETECVSLRQSNDQLESANGSLEQRCHELSQQLKIATLAMKELQGSTEVSTELERELEELKEEGREKDRKVAALEEVSGPLSPTPGDSTDEMRFC